MASGPITWWQIDGETMETVTDFILGDSKITADGDCSHEITRRSLPGRKAMTKLDSMLKSWDITLPTKVHLVKAMVFPVVTYGCESWTIRAPKNWWFWTVVLYLKQPTLKNTFFASYLQIFLDILSCLYKKPLKKWNQQNTAYFSDLCCF